MHNGSTEISDGLAQRLHLRPEARRLRHHQTRAPTTSAIEPVIGDLKSEGHLGRCYLKGRTGDAANVILSAVGYNFRRILAWLRELLCLFLMPLRHASHYPSAARLGFLTDDKSETAMSMVRLSAVAIEMADSPSRVSFSG